MSVVHLVVGLLALAVGTFTTVRREALVARYQRRSTGKTVQAPAAYLVVGVLLVLVGISQVVLAFV